jgi:hypothetical protein
MLGIRVSTGVALLVTFGMFGCGQRAYREDHAKLVLRRVPQVTKVEELFDAVKRNDVEEARRLAPSISLREMTSADMTGRRLQFEIIDIEEIDWKTAWRLYPRGKLSAETSEVFVPFKCKQMFFGTVTGFWVRNGVVEILGLAGNQNWREKATRNKIQFYIMKQKGKTDQLRFGLLFNWYCP